MKKKKNKKENEDSNQIDLVLNWHLEQTNIIKKTFGNICAGILMYRFGISEQYANELITKTGDL